MTQPGIEPRSPGPLANTLTAKPIFKNLQDFHKITAAIKIIHYYTMKISNKIKIFPDFL